MFGLLFNKKIFKIVLFSILFCNTFNKAKAHQIADNIYGHGIGYIGIGFQTMSLEGEKTTYTGDVKKDRMNYAISFGLGYDVFFSVLNFFHPFIGIEAHVRAPFYGTNYSIDYTRYQDVAKNYYNEIFMMHLKIGAKLNINEVFAVLPYGIMGFNVARLSTKMHDLSKSNAYANISVGLGCDIMIYNRFIFALEYRHSNTRINHVFNISTHNLLAKFGVQFL